MNIPPPPTLTQAQIDAAVRLLNQMPRKFYFDPVVTAQWAARRIYSAIGLSRCFAHSVIMEMEARFDLKTFCRQAWRDNESVGWQRNVDARFTQEVWGYDGPLGSITVEIEENAVAAARYIYDTLAKRINESQGIGAMLSLNTLLHGQSSSLPELISSSRTGIVFYCFPESITTYYRIRRKIDFTDPNLAGMTIRQEYIR